MKKRKTILVFGAIFAVFLMVSSVTAANTIGINGNDQLLKDEGCSYDGSDQVLTDDMLFELRMAIDQLINDEEIQGYVSKIIEDEELINIAEDLEYIVNHGRIGDLTEDELRSISNEFKDVLENNFEFQKLTATLNERYGEGSEPTGIITVFLIIWIIIILLPAIFFFLLNYFPAVAAAIIEGIILLLMLPGFILLAIIAIIKSLFGSPLPIFSPPINKNCLLD